MTRQTYIKFKNVREKIGKFAYQVRCLESHGRELQAEEQVNGPNTMLLLQDPLERRGRRRVSVVVDRRDKQEQDARFEYQIGIQSGSPGPRAVFSRTSLTCYVLWLISQQRLVPFPAVRIKASASESKSGDIIVS